ncbi:hypothetical protein [Paracoccus benzoatiresistens]|uniref:Uncharacterized protein n=1 Tax=Paracoccus benzoatiresistens TaxID=2997341 RepID=A0ABT4JBR9_9RHOB|nr:hypothetical protein [Paracoccus sp. EF6]MCZ0963911.1 hypothetical protein [Paracoccus sp. EF6]
MEDREFVTIDEFNKAVDALNTVTSRSIALMMMNKYLLAALNEIMGTDAVEMNSALRAAIRANIDQGRDTIIDQTVLKQFDLMTLDDQPTARIIQFPALTDDPPCGRLSL